MDAVRYKSQDDQAGVEGVIDCNLLLAWMTHTGEGSWTSFRRCVEDLTLPGAEIPETVRRLRVSLSDLAHAEFFAGGAQKWRVLAPQLCGSAAKPESVVLCGARTQRFVDAVYDAAERFGCRIESCRTGPYLPDRIAVVGAEDGIAAVSQNIGLPYLRRAAAIMVQALEPISYHLQHAATEAAPRNWKVRSFDLQSLRWVDGLRPRSACEFTPRYGSSRYFLNDKNRGLLAMPKRESVYASAQLAGVPIASFDAEERILTVPFSAPLPERFARVACLCSGRPSELADGRFLYREITLDVAAALFAALGHPRLPCTHPLLLGKCADG